MGKRMLSIALVVAVACLVAAPSASSAKTVVVKRTTDGRLKVYDPNDNIIRRVARLPFKVVGFLTRSPKGSGPAGFGKPINQNTMQGDVSVAQKAVDTAIAVPTNLTKTAQSVAGSTLETTKRVLDPWGDIGASR